MAHIILTGATGNAGAAILHYCLTHSSVSKISILSRRPVKLADGHSKANVIIHSDFNSYPPDLLAQLQGATGCIWAQGKSSLGMNESDYNTLSHDYPLAAAKAFSTLSARLTFVYISGEGADPTETSRQVFARIKGRAETSLLTLASTIPSLQIYNARPGMIDPAGKFLGDRKRGTVEAVGHFFGPVFRVVTPGLHISSEQLAEAVVGLAVGDGAALGEGRGVEGRGRTLRNTALRRLVGL